jgi:hypothetical protein
MGNALLRKGNFVSLVDCLYAMLSLLYECYFYDMIRTYNGHLQVHTFT